MTASADSRAGRGEKEIRPLTTVLFYIVATMLARRGARTGTHILNEEQPWTAFAR